MKELRESGELPHLDDFAAHRRLLFGEVEAEWKNGASVKFDFDSPFKKDNKIGIEEAVSSWTQMVDPDILKNMEAPTIGSENVARSFARVRTNEVRLGGPGFTKEAGLFDRPHATVVHEFAHLFEANKEFLEKNVNYLVKRSRGKKIDSLNKICLLYTSPSPRDRQKSRMPSSA